GQRAGAELRHPAGRARAHFAGARQLLRRGRGGGHLAGGREPSGVCDLDHVQRPGRGYLAGRAGGRVAGPAFRLARGVLGGGRGGLLAMLAVAVLVPATRNESTPAALGTELRAIASTPVLLGLTTTVFGFAGVFVVYT